MLTPPPLLESDQIEIWSHKMCNILKRIQDNFPIFLLFFVRTLRIFWCQKLNLATYEEGGERINMYEN